MIAVLTCPRPQGATYLDPTLTSVESSATDPARVLVIDAAELPVRPDLEARGWRFVRAAKPARARPTENKWAFWAVLEEAARAGGDLLFFEDDVLGCPRATLYAEQLPVPKDCALVSLYAPWGDATHAMGIWRMHSANFSYCQALKIPERTVRALVDARGEMEAMAFGGSDEAIREIGQRLDWLIGFHIPGLFQHVGAVSAVSGGPEVLSGARSSKAWAADIDAFRFQNLGGHNHYR